MYMSNDADLKVNFELLEDSKRQLNKIHREFKDIGGRKEDMHPYWGSSEVSGAMDEFVDNWDDYRAKMLEKIEVVESLVKSSLKGFAKLDDDLAKGLEEGGKKK